MAGIIEVNLKFPHEKIIQGWVKQVAWVDFLPTTNKPGDQKGSKIVPIPKQFSLKKHPKQMTMENMSNLNKKDGWNKDVLDGIF